MQGKLVPLVCLVVFGFAQHGAAALIGYWPLDEGSGDGVFDRTGNGHNGTIEGATWASPGWDGKGVCLDFDGAGHLVRIADAQTLRFSSEAAYALTAWVHVNSLPGRWVGVVTKGRDTAHWYGIWIEGGNRWVFGHQPNNLHGSPVTAGLWTHVAVVYDNGLKRLYLNGVLDAEVSASGSGDSASDLVFGAALGVTEFAPVRLNEIRLYDHALNADEVVVSMQRLLPPELARDPVPENEAVDVPREIVLRWAPGAYGATRDVYFGVVFEDVNEASRADPRGVLVSQGQTATTYSLSGWLDFETTYYWRIDEVNAAPSGAIFEGKVWSFTTEPLAYPVANVIATTNGDSDEDAGPENTVDGSGLDDQDRHTTSSTDMWLAEAPEDEPLYIQYEFDRVYKLHQMLVWNYNVQFELALGIGLKDVTVEYSVDGEEWILLSNVEFAQATARSAYTANTTVPFDGVPARYVRLTVNSNWGGRMNQFGLSEVRFLFVPAHAREPQPADGAADVSVNTTLAWRAGRNAVSHEVYFGTDAEALDLAATVEATSYDPGALNLGATYYWQVNAVQEAESWTGDLWSFATQQYLVVDDFES
ncbi:MAG: discoidin domain-containing protein, partial [Methanoculleus marisnigri]|nr:discoidin domain-containing protein [Methanoculleus marisnigri]